MLFDDSTNSKCGTHVESYMPLIILNATLQSAVTEHVSGA